MSQPSCPPYVVSVEYGFHLETTHLFIVLSQVPLVRHIWSQLPQDHHSVEHGFFVERSVSLFYHVQQRQSLRIEEVIFVVLESRHLGFLCPPISSLQYFSLNSSFLLPLYFNIGLLFSDCLFLLFPLFPFLDFLKIRFSFSARCKEFNFL